MELPEAIRFTLQEGLSLALDSVYFVVGLIAVISFLILFMYPKDRRASK